jgi:O-antigen/teichoic acid export membrane protein
VVGLLITLAMVPLFFLLFPDVPASEASDVTAALLLIGLNLALTFPLSVFDATLSGYQRFDLLNAVDIPVLGARVGLVFSLIGGQNDLVTLALLTLGATLVAAFAKAVLCFRMDAGLRLKLSCVTWEAGRSLFSFGIWYFLLSLARVLTPKIRPLIVGNRLSSEQVTSFSNVSRLTEYASSIIIAGTQVLTPVATALYAKQRHEEQQRLIIEGSKYCLALSCFFLTLFLCLGKALLVLWMGPEFGQDFPLLAILALGEALPMAQWLTYSIILGMGRHRALAYFSILESLMAIPLAIALAQPYGLMGVCLAFAIPGTLCRGVFQMLYACRLAEISVGRYFIRALVPPLVISLAPAAGLALLAGWHQPQSWLELFAFGGGFTLCFGLFGLGLLKHPRFWTPHAGPDADKPCPCADDPTEPLPNMVATR